MSMKKKLVCPPHRLLRDEKGIAKLS